MEDKLYLVFEEKGKSIKEQFKSQGYKLGNKKDWQALFDNIKKLFANGVLTLKDRNKCLKRLLKEMYSDSVEIDSEK